VQIILDGVPIHLSGGSLPSMYILEQMHFHWDAEHTVDGQRDPLELHLVHYNEHYANFSTAARYEDGIVVVAVLFKVGTRTISPRDHSATSIHRRFILAEQLRQRGPYADREGDEDGVELGGKERDRDQEQADTLSVPAEGPHDLLPLPGLSDHPGMPGIRNVVRHDGEAHRVGGAGDSNYLVRNSGDARHEICFLPFSRFRTTLTTR